MTAREKRESVNRGLRAWGTMYGKPEVAETLCTKLPEKRVRAAPGSDGRKLEAAVNDEIYEAAQVRPGVSLWRNNRGVAQYGNDMVRYGVGPNGASDWIGYRVIWITHEMVGKRMAQFIAIEAKRPGEKPDENQREFIDKVNADGGVAGPATSYEEAISVLAR